MARSIFKKASQVIICLLVSTSLSFCVLIASPIFASNVQDIYVPVSSSVDSAISNIDPFSSSVAYAATDYEQRSGGSEGEESYYHFNPARIFDRDGKSESNQGTGGGFVAIIEFIITAIGIPVGIILSTWRVMYWAVFGLLMGRDPLNFAGEPRYSDVKKGRSDTFAEKQNNWAFNNNPMEAARSYHNNLKEHGTYAHKRTGEDTGSNGMQSNSSKSYADFLDNNRLQNNVSKYIIVECKFMFLGFFITFAVWAILKVLIQFSIFLLDMADTMSGSVIVQ